MKRLLTAAFALLLVCAMCVIPASAEEGTFNLIPGSDATWTKTDCEGYSVNVEYTDDAVIFSADGYWPCADTYYADDARITANIDEYSLVYDFTVEIGCTNINFYFTDGFGSSATYSICNNSLGSVSYDTGSGDLNAAEYKGVIRLSDFVNSTMFLGGSTFPANMITEDNEIIFQGIQVYSVSSAKVTINQLAIVKNDIAGDPFNADTETEEESSEAEVDESSEAEVDESKTESVATSEDASAETSEPTATEEEGLGIWLWVIIGAAVVVVVVIVVVIAKKK